MVYKLYGTPGSLYTAKARSYLIKQGLAFENRSIGDAHYRQSIMPQVGRWIMPVLEAPDGTLIQDGSVIIDTLEATGLAKTTTEVYAREQILLHERQKTEIVVQTLRIGDIAIATEGGHASFAPTDEVDADEVEQRWKGLQPDGLFRQQSYFREVCYNKLAERMLSAGYELERARGLGFTIKGFPAELRERFSKRRHTILKEAAAAGAQDAAMSRTGALDALAQHDDRV